MSAFPKSVESNKSQRSSGDTAIDSMICLPLVTCFALEVFVALCVGIGNDQMLLLAEYVEYASVRPSRENEIDRASKPNVKRPGSPCALPSLEIATE
jgi:hypothetical protein